MDQGLLDWLTSLRNTLRDYEGSITLDPVLMKETNLIEFEKVHVLDVTNGNRLETYVIIGFLY